MESLCGGEEGVCLSRRGRYRAGWWAKIVSLGGSESGWFLENSRRKLGNGADTKFWLHSWAGAKPLKTVFPRLFQLSANKEATVEEWGRWVDSVWVWELKWRRELRDCELEAVNLLMSSISSCVLNADEVDGWSWNASPEGVYSTKSAYEILISSRNDSTSPSANSKLLAKVWISKAPHKALVTTWRLLRNRLATCDNLRKRRILLKDDDMKCNFCHLHEETANHVFLLCPKISEVWDEIQAWLGLTTVRPCSVKEHLESFANLGKGKKFGKFLKSTWICTIWSLWKKRNSCRFDGVDWDIKSFLLEIKVRLWCWNKLFEILEYDSSLTVWCSNELISRL